MLFKLVNKYSFVNLIQIIEFRSYVLLTRPNVIINEIVLSAIISFKWYVLFLFRELKAKFLFIKGLMNEILRDEILVQIINQTWNQIDLIKSNKAWLLMSNCLSCFSPSAKFYKYLFK